LLQILRIAEAVRSGGGAGAQTRSRASLEPSRIHRAANFEALPMPQHDDAWLEHQRRRWMRHDAHLWVRPDAYLFMPPDAPRWYGKDAVRYFWPEPEPQPPRPTVDRKYSPDQPRVSAGNPDGGQWTSGGGSIAASRVRDDRLRISPNNELIRDRTGQESWKWFLNEYRTDGSLARQTVSNRDGGSIQSVFAESPAAEGWDERHAVRLNEGSITTFENAGATQTVLDRSGNQLAQTVEAGGAEPQAAVRPASFAPALAAAAGAAALPAAAVLYTWWSSQNGPDSRAVLSFRAEAFLPGATSADAAVRVERLSSEQVQDVCPRYQDVQRITNDAADTTHRGAYESAAAYGTAVHKKIEVEINGPTTVPRSPPRDPDFRAEASVIKSRDAGYGLLGSRRVDILENPRTGTVCVYDIKTGGRGLSGPRAIELASSVSFYYPGTQRIIVTEVRPNR
jgi:hypothetical protein